MWHFVCFKLLFTFHLNNTRNLANCNGLPWAQVNFLLMKPAEQVLSHSSALGILLFSRSKRVSGEHSALMEFSVQLYLKSPLQSRDSGDIFRAMRENKWVIKDTRERVRMSDCCTADTACPMNVYDEPCVGGCTPLRHRDCSVNEKNKCGWKQLHSNSKYQWPGEKNNVRSTEHTDP